MHIPDEVIDKIVAARDIYVAFMFDFDYDLTESEVLGVFTVYKNAQEAIMKKVYVDKLKYNHFLSPHKRYEKRHRTFNYDNDLLYDSWKSFHMADYMIQTWKQDDPSGKLKVEYFNVDKWLKEYLDEDINKTDERRQQFGTWSTKDCFPKEWYNLFDVDKKTFIPKSTNDKWIAKFGYRDVGYTLAF